MTTSDMDGMIGATTVGPVKIGGWLYLPAFGLVIGCLGLAIQLCVGIVLITMNWGVPLGVVTGAANAQALLAEHNIQIHKLREVLAVYVGFEAVLMALLVHASVRFFSKKRNAPPVLIRFLIVRIVVGASLAAIFILADKDYTISGNVSGLAQNTAMDCVAGILAAVIWIPYFKGL